MGMDVGSKGGSMATMNVVPLIDILLVLIIIFMVITPLTPKGLDALVPQPAPPNANQQQQIEQKTIVVQILERTRLGIRSGRASRTSSRSAPRKSRSSRAMTLCALPMSHERSTSCGVPGSTRLD
jgi:biopolymer transport protein ExbD